MIVDLDESSDDTQEITSQVILQENIKEEEF
jgi:hypothetical protein